MKKIPTLFKRNYKTYKIYNEVTKGCEWVIDGEGIATRKLDGTACMIKDSILYKRYDFKVSRKGTKRCLKGGITCEPAPDPETGHWPWWIPITDSPEDKWHREAFEEFKVLKRNEAEGTYELCGPRINGNPEKFTHHILIRHGIMKLLNCPRTFEEIKEYFERKDIEGIVWHRKNGDMCKVKKRDFGMKRI